MSSPLFSLLSLLSPSLLWLFLFLGDAVFFVVGAVVVVRVVGAFIAVSLRAHFKFALRGVFFSYFYFLLFTVLAAPVGDTTLKTGEVGVLYDVFVRPCGALLRFCSPCTIQICLRKLFRRTALIASRLTSLHDKACLSGSFKRCLRRKVHTAM